ncbi:hypothetical protein PHMEG_0007654 [Phytophthora megakarya]|uniref:Uncharacterized protein n=1 Tax=Phytophthora megakarya TaxID=4795 RepID=A0A225WL46_9STRA|nr:hypothetical protein PHMEG_0007654 [Phytophthora megakarya]
MSRTMAFEDGRIYIVELPATLHEELIARVDGAVSTATGTGDQHLVSHRSSYVELEGFQKLESDCRFGPADDIGAIRPGGIMAWGEYHTLKVEVGVLRRWSSLGRKADQWRQFPGVEYILCICLSQDLRIRQYKLYTVDDRATPLPPKNPRNIVNPTDVPFNSSRLLVARSPPPVSFSGPNVAINLYTVVEDDSGGRRG